MKYYGVCKNRKTHSSGEAWGEAPENFDERKHFLKCPCGSTMYLDRHDPKKAGYRDKDKVIVTVTKQ